MTKQGYSYLDRSIQEISGFFETRVENLETPTPTANYNKSNQEKEEEKFQETESCLL